MIFKIDIDCVIRDILTPICGVYNKYFKDTAFVSDIHDYNLEAVFPSIRATLGYSARDFFFLYHADEVMMEAKPYHKAAEAIRALKYDADDRVEYNRIILVTHQFPQNLKGTFDWLKTHEIPYDDICFTRDKWLVKGDILIDDNPAHLSDEREEAMPVKIIQPYNKDIRCSEMSFDSLWDVARHKDDVVRVVRNWNGLK